MTSPADQSVLVFKPDERPYIEQVRVRLRSMTDAELIN
jgi:hypothetical protein